jgi:hypothetical protein
MWKSAAGFARDHRRAAGSPPRSPVVTPIVGVDDLQWPPKSGTVGTDVQRTQDNIRPAGPSLESRVLDQSQTVVGDDALLVTLRRTIQQRQAAASGAVSDSIRPTAPVALRGHRGPTRWLPRPTLEAAFVLLIVAGALEAGYILRVWGNLPSGGGEPFTATDLSAVPGAITDPDERSAKAARVAAEADVARPSPASASPGGRLTVRSDPPGAKVWIDERAAGVTPLTLSNLPAGERRLLLKHGDRAIRQTVRIDSDSAVAVIVPLPPVSAGGSGWLAVRAPLDMDVLENGVVVGTTRSPRIMLPSGTHHLHLVHALTGYDRSEKVNIAAGEVARLDVALPESTMSLNALPWAEVWLDGGFIGETPLGNLSVTVGTHQLTFRHPELGEKSLSAVVRAGVPTRVTADMRK